MMTQNADKKRNQIQMFCMDDMVPNLSHILGGIIGAVIGYFTNRKAY